MHVETVEIGMSTLGTGALTEFALLGHWGDAFGHGLTKGKETVLSDLVDQQGNSLYTGYYYTLLKVPPKHLLSSFKIWSHLELGVNTTAFGAAMLNSAFRAGVPGSVESDDPTGRVEMDAGHYVLIEGIEGGQKPSVPKPGRRVSPAYWESVCLNCAARR